MYARTRQPILPHVSAPRQPNTRSTPAYNSYTSKHHNKTSSPYTRAIRFASVLFITYTVYLLYTNYYPAATTDTYTIHSHDLYHKRHGAPELSDRHDQFKFTDQQVAQHEADTHHTHPTIVLPQLHGHTPVDDDTAEVLMQKTDDKSSIQQPDVQDKLANNKLSEAYQQHAADAASAAHQQPDSDAMHQQQQQQQHDAPDAMKQPPQPADDNAVKTPAKPVDDAAIAAKIEEDMKVLREQAEYMDEVLSNGSPIKRPDQLDGKSVKQPLKPAEIQQRLQQAGVAADSNAQGDKATADAPVKPNADKAVSVNDIQMPYRAGWIKTSRLCSNMGFDQSQNFNTPLLKSIESLAQQGITCFVLDVFSTEEYTTAVQFDQPPVSIVIGGKDTGLTQPMIKSTNAAQTLYVGQPDTVKQVLQLMDSAEKFTSEQLDKHLADSLHGGVVAKLTDVLALLDKHVMIETVTLQLHGHLQTNVAHYVTVGSLIAQYHMLHIRVFIMCADLQTAERIHKHSKWLDLVLPVSESMPPELQSQLCVADPAMTISDRLAVLRDYAVVMPSVQMFQSCGSALDAVQDVQQSHNIWMQARIQKSVGVYVYTVDTATAANELAGQVDGLISNTVIALNQESGGIVR